MRQLLPLLLWHGFCTAKHCVKFYARFGVWPPSPATLWRYTKASLLAPPYSA